jgi:uncharacterized membrane protein YhhN
MFFVLTGLAAVADWFAVHRRLPHLELILKPATMVFLIVAAASSHLHFLAPWVLAALVFGLLGDIGLMLSEERKGGRPDVPFLLGLSSFLLGHICYIVAFVRLNVDTLHVVAGVLIVAGVSVVTLPTVLGGARRLGGNELAMIVVAYAAALSTMTVLGIGTGAALVGIGGVAFLASDTLIAGERFATPVPHGRLLIIVTYHLAQVLIVVGLINAV